MKVARVVSCDVRDSSIRSKKIKSRERVSAKCEEGVNNRCQS